LADISGASASCKIYVNTMAGLAGPHLEYPPISRGRRARAPLRRAQRRLSGGLDTIQHSTTLDRPSLAVPRFQGPLGSGG